MTKVVGALHFQIQILGSNLKEALLPTSRWTTQKKGETFQRIGELGQQLLLAHARDGLR